MKVIFSILFLALTLYASEAEFSIAMRNSKYGAIGFEYNDIGVVYENSVFIDVLEKQYARLLIYHDFSWTDRIDLRYSLYYGTRYNQDYYDYGGIFEINTRITKHALRFSGIYQPYYDSDLEISHGYSAALSLFPLSEVGVTGGIRNIPDYRETERRVFAGLVFDTPHLLLQPIISTPLRSGAKSVTRLTINFVYRLSLLENGS